jgi:hypothetical protein
MQSFVHKGIATIAIIGCVGLVAVATFQGPAGFGARSASDSPPGSDDETTGSVGAVSTDNAKLPLTDAQRERIYQAVTRFPDAARGEARAPELADKLPSDEPLQDLPASVIGEIPLLHAHKFMKLNDRILLIDPASRAVVAMIPRYRLLP